MTVGGALAGGLVGTVVLTSSLRAAQEIGWTRMDIPLLLGTMLTPERRRASVFGYTMHFVNGLLFALVYYAIFVAVGRAGWIFGAALGLVHDYGERTVAANLIAHVAYGAIVGGFAAHIF